MLQAVYRVTGSLGRMPEILLPFMGQEDNPADRSPARIKGQTHIKSLSFVWVHGNVRSSDKISGFNGVSDVWMKQSVYS